MEQSARVIGLLSTTFLLFFGSVYFYLSHSSGKSAANFVQSIKPRSTKSLLLSSVISPFLSLLLILELAGPKLAAPPPHTPPWLVYIYLQGRPRAWPWPVGPWWPMTTSWPPAPSSPPALHFPPVGYSHILIIFVDGSGENNQAIYIYNQYNESVEWWPDILVIFQIMFIFPFWIRNKEFFSVLFLCFKEGPR